MEDNSRRHFQENSVIFEKEIEFITGKSYPMGIEQFLLEKAKKKGIDLGIAKGTKQRDIEIILSLYEDGVDVPRISKITKLSTEIVKRILKDNEAKI